MNNDWRHIPGFNGYMINSDGFVLSYKHFNTYPNGRFIQTDEYGYYTLTNMDNKRVKMKPQKLLELCEKDPEYAYSGGKGTYKGSRNLIRPAKDGKIHISKFFNPAKISDRELKE